MKFDLEERTYKFALKCKDLVKKSPKNLCSNIEYGKQLIRSSGSVAANYIEANESLSKKDFIVRIKICRKECKESRLWLKLIDTIEDENQFILIQESLELVKIFTTILKNTK